ncbi:hypothetical protein JOS77_10385 [Chromobacterium haemolyticum]|nr:hypothetical protein JOS77_10385 [Chromobacterium haemolyticum]
MLEVIISDTAMPAPNCLHSMRNGLSVTPAMGATISRFFNVYEPMRMRAKLWDN